MEVRGQLHVPAPLFPGQEPPVAIAEQAGWDPEPVWTRWWRETVITSDGGEVRHAIQQTVTATSFDTDTDFGNVPCHWEREREGGTVGGGILKLIYGLTIEVQLLM
jgi:hypothetical protein